MSNEKNTPQTTKEKIVRFVLVFGVGIVVFAAVTVLRHM
jgi:hypothetical protein